MVKPVMTIFHMSDVHIGEYRVEIETFKTVVDKIVRQAKDVESPLILVTGDITSDGLKEEYESFAEIITGTGIPLIVIPGNHDERNYGAAHFERLFGKRFKTYANENVALYAVDSAEPDNDSGHVGREHYPDIIDFFTEAKDKIRIFTLHHHLVAVPHTGREYNVVEDSGDILGILDEMQCSLVLNGHRHVPWMWRLNDLVLFTTGTLLSRRIRGANTQVMTRVSLSREQVAFTLCETKGSEKPFARSALRV